MLSVVGDSQARIGLADPVGRTVGRDFWHWLFDSGSRADGESKRTFVGVS
jgi:hypothetical protein